MFFGLFENKTQYVGTVEGHTKYKNEEHPEGQLSVFYWVLYTRNGVRKYDTSGTEGSSQHFTKMKADVKAWARNGPLPPEIKLPEIAKEHVTVTAVPPPPINPQQAKPPVQKNP